MKLTALLTPGLEIGDDICRKNGENVPCHSRDIHGNVFDRKFDNPLGQFKLRRYVDLKEMAVKLWSKEGLRGKEGFNEMKYWTYGCHCFLVGDRPMSQMSNGKPKDELDRKCKEFKNCHKCVQEKHGPEQGCKSDSEITFLGNKLIAGACIATNTTLLFRFVTLAKSALAS